jgi:hypothetical protein
MQQNEDSVGIAELGVVKQSSVVLLETENETSDFADETIESDDQNNRSDPRIATNGFTEPLETEQSDSVDISLLDCVVPEEKSLNPSKLPSKKQSMNRLSFFYFLFSLFDAYFGNAGDEETQDIDSYGLDQSCISEAMEPNMCCPQFPIDEEAFKSFLRSHYCQGLFNQLQKDGVIDCDKFAEFISSAKDIFLSHDWGAASSNHERVKRFRDKILEKDPTLRVWLDEEEMKGDIQTAMANGISRSSCVVVFVTENYMRKADGQSPYCPNNNVDREFTLIENDKQKGNVFPVLMESECNPKKWFGKLKSYLGSTYYVDFTRDELLDEAVTKILNQFRQSARYYVSHKEDEFNKTNPTRAVVQQQGSTAGRSTKFNHFQMISRRDLPIERKTVLCVLLTMAVCFLLMLTVPGHWCIVMAARYLHYQPSTLLTLYSIGFLKEIFSLKEFKEDGKVPLGLLRNHFDVDDFMKANYTASEFKQADFSASSLAKAGLGILELKNGGFTLTELQGSFTFEVILKANFTCKDLHSAKFPLKDLKGTDICSLATLVELNYYSVYQLKEYFGPKDLLGVNFTCAELRNVKFPVVDLKDHCSVRELKTAGFLLSEIKPHVSNTTDLKSEYSCKELKEVGFKAIELKDFGYALDELKAAGFSCNELRCLYTVSEMINAGFSLSVLKEAGVSVSEFFAEKIDVPALKSIGFTPVELKMDFTVSSLLEAFYVTELRNYDFPVYELIKANCELARLKNGGYTLGQLKDYFAPRELWDHGYSVTEIRNSGIPVANLISSGIPLLRLAEAGMGLSLLKAHGVGLSRLVSETSSYFSVWDLKHSGYSAKELLGAKVTLSALREAGFTVSDLKQSDQTLNSFIIAGYSLVDLKEGGITVAELVATKRFNSTNSWVDLKHAGYQLPELLHHFELENLASREEEYSLMDFKKAGASAGELFHLKQRLFRSVNDFKKAGYPLNELRMFFSIAELRENGSFSLSELKNVGVGPSELLSGGNCALADLKATGYSLNELKNAEVPLELLKDYFDLSQLKMEYSGQELIRAGLITENTQFSIIERIGQFLAFCVCAVAGVVLFAFVVGIIAGKNFPKLNTFFYF